jgi:hypothetical protein
VGDTLLILAVATERPALSRGVWILLAVLAASLLLLLLIGLGVWYYRRRKAETVGSAGRISVPQLTAVWTRFLSGLPTAARPLVSRYPWVVVLGESGAGKTALIDSKADWQSQSNSKFPSYTQEPLLKLYLGSSMVVHELSPQLVADSHKAVTDALNALWRPLCRVRPPLALVVISLSQLRRASPLQLRIQAQRIEGTLRQLSVLCGAPIRTRICLTHLDALSSDAAALLVAGDKEPVSGLDHLARRLQELRVPLVLSLSDLPATHQAQEGGDRLSSSDGVAAASEQPPGPLAARFLELAAYLKFALPKLPKGGFDDIVRCLAGAPESLRPLEILLSELVSRMRAGSRSAPASVHLEQLYLMPLRAELQSRNPLLAGARPPRLTDALHQSGLRGLWSALRNSRVLSTGHAKLCGALLLLALLLNGAVYSYHSQMLGQLEEATQMFDQDVNRSLCTAGQPADSARVRRSALLAGDRLGAVQSSERSWPLLGRSFAPQKKLARQMFLSAVRNAYFVPQLHAENRRIAYSGISELGVQGGGLRWPDSGAGIQPTRRNKVAPGATVTPDMAQSEPSAGPVVNIAAEEAMTRIVYALAAIYANRDGVLEELLRKNMSQVAAELQIAERTLKDYLSNTAAERGRCGPGLKESRPPPPPGAQDGPSLLTDEQQWKRFLADVRDTTTSRAGAAGLVRARVLSLQSQASRLAAVLELVRRARPLGELADALEEECGVDVKSSVGPLGWALVPPAWLEQNLKALHGATQLVLSSRIEPLPANELDMKTLQDLLKSLAPKSKEPGQSERVYVAKFGDSPELQISETHWLEVLAEARRQTLQAQLQERLRGGEFGEEEPPARGKRRYRNRDKKGPRKAAAHAAKANRADDPRADGMPQPSAGLPDPYNKVAFERSEKPALLGADQALAAAALPPAEKARVSAAVLAQAQRYARRYAETLRSHWGSYGVRADTAPALRAAVGELLLPESSLNSHLRQVADNTNLGELPGPYLQPLVEHLAPLRPLIKLATIKDGVYLELEPYRAVLSQLASALDAAAPSPPGAEVPLRDSLSGLVRLTLSMLAEEETSPLVVTQRWLDKAGVPPDLRGPFLAPLRRALRLGTAEVERALAARWESVYKAQVQPLYSRFPFDRAAQQEVALSALEVIHPKDGALWRFAREEIGGVVNVLPDGTAAAKRQPGGPLTLPANLVPTLTQLGRLSQKLWDGKEGARRPIELRVRPQPLVGAVGPYAVTRAYLSVGSAAVVGYNQMPSERSLPVPWWNQENAAVGVDLSTPDSPARQHASIGESSSVWSLWRLLLRGQFGADGRVTFRIPVEVSEARGSVEVSFVFAESPFALFQLPRSTDKER